MECYKEVCNVQKWNKAEKCANMQIQSLTREYVDGLVRVADTGDRGIGVVAVSPITKGQILMEYIGEVITGMCT